MDLVNVFHHGLYIANMVQTHVEQVRISLHQNEEDDWREEIEKVLNNLEEKPTDEVVVHDVNTVNLSYQDRRKVNYEVVRKVSASLDVSGFVTSGKIKSMLETELSGFDSISVRYSTY